MIDFSPAILRSYYISFETAEATYEKEIFVDDRKVGSVFYKVSGEPKCIAYDYSPQTYYEPADFVFEYDIKNISLDTVYFNCPDKDVRTEIENNLDLYGIRAEFGTEFDDIFDDEYYEACKEHFEKAPGKYDL